MAEIGVGRHHQGAFLTKGIQCGVVGHLRGEGAHGAVVVDAADGGVEKTLGNGAGIAGGAIAGPADLGDAGGDIFGVVEGDDFVAGMHIDFNRLGRGPG